MRKRFRGNQPISVSQELEGGGPAQATGAKGGTGQLYGGRPAFQAVKERSGLEPENQMDPEKTRGL
jgi:cytochrome c oxidase assembly factor 5